MLKYLLLITIILFGACNKKGQQHDSAATDHPAEHFSHTSSYYGDYSITDKDYGTATTVKLENEKRIMVTNSLPNHKTGDFPNSGNPNSILAQKRTLTFPENPVYTGKAKWAREPGVALNGIKFEPQTAEMVNCESGEHYRIEALQDTFDLGLDFNNAHVQPTGSYHYHGVPTEAIKILDKGKDLVHIGFAYDGFPIYYSKSGAYKPSFKLVGKSRSGEDCAYTNPRHHGDVKVEGTSPDGTYGNDYEYIAELGDLDECNGAEVDGQYMYFITEEFPYTPRCLMGEFEEQKRPRQGGERPPRGNRPPPKGDRSPPRN